MQYACNKKNKIIKCLKKKHCTGGSDQKHSKEKEMQLGKVAFWEGFTNSWGKKRRERQGRKGKIYPTECRVSRNSKER